MTLIDSTSYGMTSSALPELFQKVEATYDLDWSKKTEGHIQHLLLLLAALDSFYDIKNLKMYSLCYMM
jgi:hypothetical protein